MRSFWRLCLLVVSSLLLFFYQKQVLKAEGGYDFFDLGPMNTVADMSQVSLNGGGVIVVGSRPVNGFDHAVMWMNGRVTDLHEFLYQQPNIPNRESYALSVGTGVGGFKVREDGGLFGFWWVNDTMLDFNYTNIFASEKVVGTMFPMEANPDFVWAVNLQSELMLGEPGRYYFVGSSGIYELPSLSNSHFTEPHRLATDLLGNNGEFVGWSLLLPGGHRAVWGNATKGEIVNLGLLTKIQGYNSQAWAFNRLGQIVGDSHVDDGGSYRPALFSKTAPPIDLSTAEGGGSIHGSARGVNNFGHVVGYMANQGTIWTVGPGLHPPADKIRAVWVSDILPNEHHWLVEQADCINDAGCIAGLCSPREDREKHGFLLIPRKDPSRVPPAPDALQVQYVELLRGNVRLSWRDNAVAESWFEIERKTGNAPFYFLQAVPADSTEFVDSVISTTEPIYRIRAVNQLGPSEYSNEAQLIRPELTIRIEPPDAGKVILTPTPSRDGRYAPGDHVFLEAKPAFGYVFNNWDGASAISPDIGTVTISSNLTVIARFKHPPHPPNDDLANRITLKGDSVATQGTNVGATQEPGENFTFGQSVWWEWKAPASGLTTVTTRGSDFDTALGIFIGDDLLTFGLIDFNLDESDTNKTSLIQFQATAGVSYVIGVDGEWGASGTIILRILAPGSALTTPTMPTFSRQPADTTVFVGQPLLLTAEANGEGELRYQWWHNGSPVPGATEATLFVAFVSPLTAGNYVLSVSNSGGTNSSQIARVIVAQATELGLSNIRYSGTQLTMVASGHATNVVLEASSDLTKWLAVRKIPLLDGDTTLTDSVSEQTRQFYRLRGESSSAP